MCILKHSFAAAVLSPRELLQAAPLNLVFTDIAAMEASSAVQCARTMVADLLMQLSSFNDMLADHEKGQMLRLMCRLGW